MDGTHKARSLGETGTPATAEYDLVKVLADALQEIAAARDVAQIAAAVTDTVSHGIPGAGGCALYIVDESTHSLRPSSVAICKGTPVPWRSIPLDSDISQRIFSKSPPTEVSDTQLVGQIVANAPRGSYPTLLAIPLTGKEGPLGLVGVRLPTADWCTADQVRVLEIVASCAALAMARERRPVADVLYDQSLFDSVPAGLVITNAEGHVAAINATMRSMVRELGTVDVAIPCSVVDASCPPCLVSLLDPCHGTVVGPYSTTLDIAEGNRRTYQIVPALVGATGEGKAYLVLDVTSARLAAQMRSHFTAQVAHELRTPLQHIMGFASILNDLDEMEGETFHRFLSHIIDESKRLARLVDDLADLSHMDNGRFSISKAPTDINDTVNSVVERLEPSAEGAGVAVRLSEPCPAITVLTDRMRVEQVLLNLAENALKFTQAGGAVTISCRATDTSLTFSVSDNGPGMPQSALERIFERYYQIPGTRSRSSRRGMGLGLYITRQIVHALGGTIWVDSELGHGSTFSFRIPRE